MENSVFFPLNNFTIPFLKKDYKKDQVELNRIYWGLIFCDKFGKDVEE